jgi:hypothetical protein
VQALRAQGKNEEAAAAETRFKKAWKGDDAPKLLTARTGG